MTNTDTNVALKARDILLHCAGDFERALGFVSRTLTTCYLSDKPFYQAVGDRLAQMAADAALDAEVV